MSARTLEDLERLEQQSLLVDDLLDLARRHDLAATDAVEAMVAITGMLGGIPNAVFEQPPEYVRSLDSSANSAQLPHDEPPAGSTHTFFDVVQARASRRDYGTDPLDLKRLLALLYWTVGERGECIAYDYRSAPLRYIPSAGGLASIDAYVIAANVEGLESGSYYFDLRDGLKQISRGYMAEKVAELNPGQEWLGRASAFVVLAGNLDRVAHKYGPMAFKLMMMDAGIAVGHAELVSTALELRSCIIGGLSQSEMSRLLRVDGKRRVPLITLAVGTRSGQ